MLWSFRRLLYGALLLASANCGQSIQFFNVTSDDFPGASEACLGAVNSEIECTGYLVVTKQDSWTVQPSSDDLTGLCTDSCYSSLKDHYANVSATCAGTNYYDPLTDTSYVSTILDDQLLQSYNSTCLKSSSDGQYCALYYQAAQNGTLDPSACDSCQLEAFQLQLLSPLGDQNDDVSSLFSSLTSSCHSTQFDISTPTSVIASPAPTSSGGCTGQTYTVRDGDTANSIALAQGISTANLLSINGLGYRDSGFPTSGDLCIANTCKVYKVQQNDSCSSISAASNITVAQLQAWNPEINAQCSNMPNITGDVICISNPDGDFAIATNTYGAPSIITTAAPAPTPVGSNTTSKCGKYYQVATGDTCQSVSLKFNILLEDFFFLNPEVNANCTNLQLDVYYCVAPVGSISTYPGYGGSSTEPFVPVDSTPIPVPDRNSLFPNTGLIIPLANETRTDCTDYFWTPKVGGNSAFTDCWTTATLFEIDREQFVLWNPSLGQNDSEITNDSTYDYPCTLSANVSYCVEISTPYTSSSASLVQPPSPTAAHENQNCTTWVLMEKNMACEDILVNYDLTISQFYEFNPTVKEDCSGLFIGTYYCISTDPDGKPPDVTTTTLDGSATQTSPGTPSNGIVTPTPTQSGMVSGCSMFHNVVKGDTCYDIAQNASIALSDFYTWNPSVKSDCSGLLTGFYVCTGIATSSNTATSNSPTQTSPGVVTPTPTQIGMADDCNSFYDVNPGDGCYNIAQTYKITLNDFYAWNPAVKDDCSGLESGFYVCVGTIAGGPSTTTPPASTSTSAGNGIATPSPVQAGMTQSCEKFYDVVSGDGCYDIAQRYSIALKDFYSWNPAVKSDCSGLQAGYYVCVEA